MTSENLFSSTMAEMTANAVAEAASRKAAVLLPAGVMEAHGPHLPIGTDAARRRLLRRPIIGGSTACSANSWGAFAFGLRRPPPC
jgi:hypothetical protein